MKNFDNAQQMAVVKSNLLLIIKFLLVINSCIKGEMTFTNSDLSVIGILSKYLNPQSTVFVENDEDLGLMKGFKTLSGTCAFQTVVNSSVLDQVLANNVTQLSFFQTRTVIVTKEKFNLTSLLNKVYVPHYLTWVIFGDYTLFPDLYIPVSSEVIFIHSTPGKISAKQIYHLKPDANETVKTLWSWDLTDATNQQPSFGIEFEKLNFRNVTMDMLIRDEPGSCNNLSGKTLLKKVECLHQNILHLMGVRLNFSINAVECLEKEYPFTFPNGSDSELFLRLKNREVDFSAISHVVLRFLKQRDYLDFVWPTFSLKSMMYLKQGRLVGRWASYLRPLESSVWWGILIWIIVTGILIHVFEKLLVNNLKFDFSLLLNLITSTLKALQVFCNQGCPDLPESCSIRIIYVLKFFVVLIFFQAYCGYLISSLTVSVPSFPFKDLKGFFENTQYQLMTLRRGFHQFYFKRVIGEEEKKNLMLPADELPETIQQAVDKLCTENYLAFSEFREDLLNFKQLKCRISELPVPVERLFVGIALPRKTPLKEFLKRELLHLKSTGIMQRLVTRLSFQTDLRDENSHNEFPTVSMTQIFSIFILLGMGVLVSIIIFTIELFIKKKQTIEYFRRIKKK